MQRKYFERMKAIVERHGGVVEKFIGDAVMAVFGLPAVHEDDALRALRAANEMRAASSSSGSKAGSALRAARSCRRGRAARHRGRRQRRRPAPAGSGAGRDPARRGDDAARRRGGDVEPLEPLS